MRERNNKHTTTATLTNSGVTGWLFFTNLHFLKYMEDSLDYIISYTSFWDDVLCRMKVTLKKSHQKRAFSPRTSWSSGTKRSFWLPAWSLHRSFQRWLPWQSGSPHIHIIIYTVYMPTISKRTWGCVLPLLWRMLWLFVLPIFCIGVGEKGLH